MVIFGGILMISRWILNHMTWDLEIQKLHAKIHLNRLMNDMYRCLETGQRFTCTKRYTTFFDELRNVSVGIARIEKLKIYARKFMMCSIEWYLSPVLRPKGGVAIVPQSIFSLQGLRGVNLTWTKWYLAFFDELRNISMGIAQIEKQ